MPTWARRTSRRPTSAWVLACVVLVWLAGRAGVIADTPLWILALLVGATSVASRVAHALVPAPARGAQLWLRIGVEITGITTILYALGWGPTLGVAYLFGTVDNLQDDGWVVSSPAIVFSVAGIGLGQLAIALGLAPTLISEPLVHGLAVLSAVCVAGTIRLLGWETRDKQRAQDEVARREQWFRALVQHASDVILVIAHDGLIEYASPGFEATFGAPAPSVIGVPALDLAHNDDLAAARIMQGIEDRPGLVNRVQLRLSAPGGPWKWFDVGVTNLRDDPAVRGVVVNLRDITERRRFEEQLRHQAFHDALTELPNRRAFVERVDRSLARAVRAGERIAVMFIDVDRFKLFNDNLGHEVGDQLLMEVAQRLEGCVRPNDMVARFGGDEFTLLLDQLGSVDDATRTADRILEELRLPVIAAGRELSVTTSIGIAVSGTAETYAGDLLREADIAMYLAKENGRARWELFDASSAPRVAQRLEAEADLLRAVQQRELTVHYQPEMSLADGSVVALEALVRWDDPRRGLVLPGEFLPLAEESSLIVAIDRLVLRTACDEGCRWAQRHGAGAPMVTVNLSSRFLRHSEAVGEVALALKESGLDPALLQVEVTEQSAIADERSTVETLEGLRGLGVRVAIDDFGTGYASLDYLKRLPVDAVKLHHSFVEGMEATASHAAIIQAVITMSHALKLKVTAEGVERMEQVVVLRSLGCDTAQGVHFSVAVPASGVDLLLEPAAVVDLHPHHGTAS
jgi:diguanylate cyclase (GGDEF)-like protein/PAS domain S-box-containing protein